MEVDDKAVLPFLGSVSNKLLYTYIAYIERKVSHRLEHNNPLIYSECGHGHYQKAEKRIMFICHLAIPSLSIEIQSLCCERNDKHACSLVKD
jgi:hypothetical protein